MSSLSQPLSALRPSRARRRVRPRPGQHDTASRARPIGQAAAHRLLWRAGMGPRPGDVAHLASMPRLQAVRSLTRPRGAARLIGPQPHDAQGTALAPYDRYGHEHLWWLDRMVRSSQPLIERMTLVLHDWFATSNEKVDNPGQMIAQNELLRAHSLGSFADLFQAITIDPAMLVWLDGSGSAPPSPNENYAREMMELFSLGADRGAYSERDIREQARALTGWTSEYSNQLGNTNFRFEPENHDSDAKAVFGQSGDFDYRDAVRLCVEHPLHPSFFVTKLWSYFIPLAPPASKVATLSHTYTSSGYAIRAVLEAILLDDLFYRGPAMVKPPVVLLAGMLRAVRRGIDTDAWVGFGEQTGQHLFYPPNVSGWPKRRWLDTSTYKGRWDLAAAVIAPSFADPGKRHRPLAPRAALQGALKSVGSPLVTRATSDYLLSFAKSAAPKGAQRSQMQAWRHNALRQLILASPDYQVA
jgi:Protein of unknown function (DUF1800)